MKHIRYILPAIFSICLVQAVVAETFFALKVLRRKVGEPFDVSMGRTLLKHEKGTVKEPIEFFKIDTGGIGKITAPNAWDLLALEVSRPDGHYKGLYQSFLIVIDTAGNTLFDEGLEAQFISFSPDGTRLAFIEVHFYHRMKDLPNYTTGVGVLDIATGEIDWIIQHPKPLDDFKSIHPLEDHPTRWFRNVLWGVDGRIYLVGLFDLYETDLETKEITKLNIPGQIAGVMSLSPDGHYILRGPHSPDDTVSSILELYDLRTEERVDDFLVEEFGRELRAPRFAIRARWFGDTGSILIADVKSRSYIDMYAGLKKDTVHFHELKLLNINDRTVRFSEENPTTIFYVENWMTRPGSYLFTQNGKVMQFPRDKLLKPLTGK